MDIEMGKQGRLAASRGKEGRRMTADPTEDRLGDGSPRLCAVAVIKDQQ